MYAETDFASLSDLQRVVRVSTIDRRPACSDSRSQRIRQRCDDLIEVLLCLERPSATDDLLC